MKQLCDNISLFLNRKPVLLLAMALAITAMAQSQQAFPPKNYPKGYFSNPLKIPISLSGNFGELRPNHYHMGLDLKTLKRENLPVHAAADGYIARVKIEPAGFGRAIYINHPNGYTSLYCHLNDFYPAFENWVKQQQYAKESWAVYLDVPAHLFPVKKGDFIAYSGNTGGSQAPHVHFEIRKTADDVNCNPMLFGFPIPDNTVPTIQRLAIYNRRMSVYEQSPRIIPVRKTGGASYGTNPAVIKVSTDKVSFGITSYDTHTGSTNLNGIYEGILYENNRAVTGFQMDNISYDNTRYLNAHIDYKTKMSGGPYLQHLSELPGYIPSIYTKFQNEGVIDLSDGAVHDIMIEVKDAYNNTAVLTTKVQYDNSVIKPSTATGKMFYPLMLDVFESDQCEFYMGEKCLYDSVHIAYRKSAAVNPAAVSALHGIGAITIPLQERMVIRIKPTRELSVTEQLRVVMHRASGAKTEVQKVEWQHGWASAKFRDFGNFQLLVDDEAPQIVPVGFANGSNVSRAARLVVTVKDNLNSFKDFRAELDGKWLRFTNDKGKTFIYTFDEKFPSGTHVLKISVSDEAGNVVVKSYTLIR